MTDERMNEITQYAQERLRTGDILAAYALEVIDFAHEAVEARKQAGHSAAELMKLLSQAEKERDEAIRLGDERLATLWDEKKTEIAKIAAERDQARAEVDRLREAVRQVHALAEKSRADWPRHTAWGALVDIHKIAKGMVES